MQLGRLHLYSGNKKKEEFLTHKGIIGNVRLSSDKREPLMVSKRRFYGSSAVGRSGRGV